jgi:hypothetical protein
MLENVFEMSQLTSFINKLTIKMKTIQNMTLIKKLVAITIFSCKIDVKNICF